MNKKNHPFLTEEQLEFQETVFGFMQKRVDPVANDHNAKIPKEILMEMGTMGLFGIPYPSTLGGQNATFVEYGLAVEQVSRRCAATGITISAHSSLAVDPIFRFGTEDQRNKFLPKMLSGEKLGAMSLTEGEFGSDAGGIKLQAIYDSDLKGYTLKGAEKVYVTNANYASIFIVFTKTDPEKGAKGISCFILEKDTPGLIIGKDEIKMGIKGSSTATLTFDGVLVPEENLLGGLNQGFKIAMTTLDGGRLGVGWQAAGITLAAIDAAIKYANERTQFGKEIANYQLIQDKIARMWVKYKAAWLLLYEASLRKDKGLPYAKEAAAAKMFASEAAMWCASQTVQIHGGSGYITETGVERLLRDAKITEIYEGTTEMMVLVIAAGLLDLKKKKGK